MSKLYDNWENQSSSYNEQVNTYVSLDMLNLTGKISLNDKKLKLSSHIKLNQNKDNSLTGISDFTLNHIINPYTKYSISQKENKTSFNADILLFKNKCHNFALFSAINYDQGKKQGNYNLKSVLRYHLKNHTIISAGIEEYDHCKSKIPNLVTLYALHGRKISKDLKVYGGFYSGYLIKEKVLKFQKFLLSLKNQSLNALLNLSLNKSEGIFIDDDFKSSFDKSISLKIFNKLSNSLTFGGDTDFEINSNKLTNKLFMNYQFDPDTILKSKWEDNDKSVTLTLNHNFRGLLRFGMSGKFYINQKNSNTSKCPIPKIKSKFGVFAEINDTLI